jgi:hypothetical protein
VTAAAARGGVAAGLVSARVAALADGVVKAMLLGKVKGTAALLVAFTLFIGGGGVLGYRALSAGPGATAAAVRLEESSGHAQTAGRRGTAPESRAAALPAGEAAKPEPAARKFFFVDLQPKANQRLADRFGSGSEGNDLAELPRGERTFGGVRFRIGDGILQLNSKQLKEQKAHEIKGIQLGHRFAKLHVLHATCYGNGKVVKDGTLIAQYRVCYHDGGVEVLPVVYGEDVRDFWLAEEAEGVTRGRVVWTGANDYARQNKSRLRLYLTSWDNPYPDRNPRHIEYHKVNDSPAAPFCVAITVEKE